MSVFHFLKEQPANPYRLGRHQVHDALPAELAIWPMRRRLVTVEHVRDCDPFDQGDIGSCTANAALGCLMTQPFRKPGWNFTEQDAVSLYSAETKLDDSQIPGNYPPDDTGSTGPWSMMALSQDGYIRTWRHTRSSMTMFQMLQDGPVSLGITWFQSMFYPETSGLLPVQPTSGVAGGHQIEVVGVDVEKQLVKICNSWGTNWGVGGFAFIAWHDLDYLLAHGGEAVQPVI